MIINQSGDDFDQAHIVFTEAFNLSAASFTPTEKQFYWRLSILGDPTMTLRRSAIMARVESIGPPSSEIVIFASRGGVSFDGAGRNMRTMPQRIPYVMMNGYSTATITGQDSDGELVHIDKELVHLVAQELPDSLFGFFPLTSTPATEHTLRLWQRTVSLVTTVMLQEDADPPTMLGREMSRLIAVAMLNCFPYHAARRSGPSIGIEPRSVRRAREFINTNAHLPIGPAEIAEAAGLSIRSLQHAFRRYHDTTPSALLRSIRLDRVHAALHDSDSRVDPVSAVARHWGFVHLGRFSAAYQQRFGELPSQTIRKRPI